MDRGLGRDIFTDTGLRMAPAAALRFDGFEQRVWQFVLHDYRISCSARARRLDLAGDRLVKGAPGSLYAATLRRAADLRHVLGFRRRFAAALVRTGLFVLIELVDTL